MKRAKRAARPKRYDRARAERYWGEERRRLGEELEIVLFAGEPRYVNVAYHRWETELLVRGLGRARRKLNVLDLACGLGRMSRVLASRGHRVIGVDNARAMLVDARRRLRRAREVGAGARDAASWSQATSDRLPFADRSFDAVVCLGLLEYLPRPLQIGTLEESLRVLKPGGPLYLVLENDRSLLRREGKHDRHRGPRPLDDGCFRGLVDRRALVAELERRGARVDLLGSNSHCALLRHGMRGKRLESRARGELARAFEVAAARDLAEPDPGWVGEACADHFFYRAVRGGRRPSRPRSPARRASTRTR